MIEAANPNCQAHGVVLETVRMTNTRITVATIKITTKPSTPRMRRRSLCNSAWWNAAESILWAGLLGWSFSATGNLQGLELLSNELKPAFLAAQSIRPNPCPDAEHAELRSAAWTGASGPTRSSALCWRKA